MQDIAYIRALAKRTCAGKFLSIWQHTRVLNLVSARSLPRWRAGSSVIYISITGSDFFAACEEGSERSNGVGAACGD